jgi:hypothetical protein
MTVFLFARVRMKLSGKIFFGVIANLSASTIAWTASIGASQYQMVEAERLAITPKNIFPDNFIRTRANKNTVIRNMLRMAAMTAQFFHSGNSASTEFTMVVAKWHVRRTSGAPKALAVALRFCCLLGLGCPKQAFAKIATPRLATFPGFSAYVFDTG